MKKRKIKDNDMLSIICDTGNDEIKECLLEKEIGKKVVIIGEVVTADGVSGYTVNIKKVK